MIKRKVGTITLALGLITAGAVLFAQNFLNITVREFLKYWPVLLIGLGIEMIIYMLINNNTEEKFKIGVDGLCVTLIIILAIISRGSAVFSGEFPFSFNGDDKKIVNNVRYKSEVKEKYNKDGVSSSYKVSNVVVYNNIGDILVVDSTTDSIKIEADITVKCNNKDDAREYIGRVIEIEEGITTTISTLEAEAIYRDAYSNAVVDFTIYVPSTSDIEIVEKFGDVSVEDFTGNAIIDNKYGSTTVNKISGEVKVDCAFGSVDLQDVDGKVSVETKNGKIDVKNLGSDAELETAFGAIEAENVNGDIKAISKNGKVEVIDIKGKAELESYFGSVKLEKVRGEVNAQSKNGSLDAKDIEGNVYLETSFGSVKYDSSDLNDIDIYAQTKFGSINTDYPISINKDGSTVTGKMKIGNGKYRVELLTNNGSIDIK